jgi:hypothetical protein
MSIHEASTIRILVSDRTYMSIHEASTIRILVSDRTYMSIHEASTITRILIVLASWIDM